MHSLSKQNKVFYLLLLAVLLVHGTFMVVKLRDNFASVSTPPEIIKIKILNEAAKAMATNQKKQIVQSEDSESTEKPKEAFLGEKDRSFDRQTVAKTINTFNQAAKGNSTVTQEAARPTQQTKKKAFQDLKLSDIGIAAGEPIPKEVQRAPASEMIKGMENGDPLKNGLSATNDYVQEVALGDFTHLNTVEYKFYGFFHRIRQKLEQFWGSSIQEKARALFKSGRKIASGEDLITSLRVTLNEKGEIVAVKILGTSGVKELDEAAVESFNNAGPFPNPPKDLLVNGKATIEWGFVVKS